MRNWKLALAAIVVSQVLIACGSSSTSGTISPEVKQMKPSSRGKRL